MIWKRSVLAAAMLLLVVNTTGCNTLRTVKARLPHIGKKKNQTANKESQDQLIGVIEMVNPEQRFVLIRKENNRDLESGTVLEARTAQGGVTRLVVAPEKKMNFVSADFTEGFPLPGEMVFLTAAAQAIAVPPVTPARDTVKVSSPANPPVPNGEPLPGVPPAQ
jgi:predicted small secreted protein